MEIAGFFMRVPYQKKNEFTLRIMASQVTGGLEIPPTPAKNTSKPLDFAGLPVILRADYLPTVNRGFGK